MGGANLRRALREPLVPFVVVAALLFVLTAVATSWRRPIIEVDRRSIAWRISELERGRGVTLKPEERQIAESAYIDEQVLAREARARGLDDDDRIRSILYQKMLHVLSGGVIQPTVAELQHFYQTNLARYAQPPKVTMDDVLVMDDAGGRRPPELRDGLDAVPERDNLKQNAFTGATLMELSWTIGQEMAETVFKAPPGTWLGPQRTAQGAHWYRVTGRTEAAPAPALDSIHDQVRFDWITEKEDALLKERVADLRRRYSVRIIEEGSPP